MTGIIDVGGGMRGIYGAGVLDRCMQDGVQFDYCCGVSAGSANMISFLAGQQGRNYLFYHDYAFRWQYMSMRNMLRRGSYINLDYIYSDLSNAGSENPLAYEKVMDAPGELCVVATRASDGKPVYFTKKDVSENHYEILKASCCIPLVCRPYIINGVKYFDGGLSDPLPIEHLLSVGCDKIVVILTRPVDYYANRQSRLEPVIRRMLSEYPQIADEIFTRHDIYDKCLDKVKKLAAAGQTLIVAPSDCCGVDTLKKTPESLDLLYQKGFEDGAVIRAFLQA